MATYNTIGDRFKNLCFIGLNKVEYFPDQSEDSIFADSWRDVTDEQSRKSLALFFFAPRDLDGEPIDPYMFLSDSEDMEDTEAAMIARQAFGDIPMLDLCRIHNTKPNTLNILVVGDVIFHWDLKDSYIQPTTAVTWTRDVQQIMKSYPRSTEKTIYTNWESSKLEELGINILPVREMPLEPDTWLNRPSFQEKYGLATLALSIMIAIGSYFMNYAQQEKIIELGNDIRQVRATTPKGHNYDALSQALHEQEKFMTYKSLTPVLVKDVANAIQLSGMEIESFEIKNHNPNTPPENMIVTVRAQKGAYKGWLQEEPIAKALIGQSITLSAVRKPPGGSALTLEGLIELRPVQEMVDQYDSQNNGGGISQ